MSFFYSKRNTKVVITTLGKEAITMKKQNLLYIILILLFITLLTACGGQSTTSSEANTEPSNDSSENMSKEEDDIFPFTFTDATGVEVTIEEKPERIVSVVPSITETVFTLGLGDQVVGVSDFDTYPEEVEEKEKIGGIVDFNVEKIISLEPNLVLGDDRLGITSEGFEQLRDAGIKVAVLPADNSFSDVYNTIELISNLTGTQNEAESIIAAMKERITEVENTVEVIEIDEPSTVYIEIDAEMWTVGSGTFMQEILDILKAENIASDQEDAFQITEEQVVQLNPDIIIATYDYVDPLEEINNREGWKDVTAVKEKQIHPVDTDLVNRPGPRLADGLEEFAKVIHPDYFAD